MASRGIFGAGPRVTRVAGQQYGGKPRPTYEELVREVVRTELRDRGYQVLEAEGGPSAIELLENEASLAALISDLSTIRWRRAYLNGMQAA